jgi:hypothetical protein
VEQEGKEEDEERERRKHLIEDFKGISSRQSYLHDQLYDEMDNTYASPKQQL